MKKLALIISCAAIALAITSCGNRRAQKAQAEKDQLDSLLLLELTTQVDSLMGILVNREYTPQFSAKGIATGAITLTDKEKKVKPDYLLPVSRADEMQTLMQKNAGFIMFTLDRAVAKLYGMPTDEYDAVIARLMADINLKDAPMNIDWGSETASQEFVSLGMAKIKEESQKGTQKYLVTRLAAIALEDMYLFCNNQELFLTKMTDKDVAELTFRLALVVDIVDRIAAYYPDMAPLKACIDILAPINATDVNQLKEQIASIKPQIEEARNNMLK